MTREEARAVYEAIVRRQRDPALLEYVGRDLFQARIFPIPPGGQRKIELSYEQVLPREGTLVHYRYPLRTEGLNARPVDEVSISIALRTSNPLKAIYSPSHDVAIVRDGEQRANFVKQARIVAKFERGVRPIKRTDKIRPPLQRPVEPKPSLPGTSPRGAAGKARKASRSTANAHIWAMRSPCRMMRGQGQ